MAVKATQAAMHNESAAHFPSLFMSYGVVLCSFQRMNDGHSDIVKVYKTEKQGNTFLKGAGKRCQAFQDGHSGPPFWTRNMSAQHRCVQWRGSGPTVDLYDIDKGTKKWTGIFNIIIYLYIGD